MKAILLCGHYTYNYEFNTTLSDDGNCRTTKKVYKSLELIGEQYAMLREYLEYKANIKEKDLDTMVSLVIESASGYFNNSNNLNNNILIGNGMFTWPVPGYTTITSEYGYRIDPITRKIFFAFWYRCFCSCWC